MRKSTRHFATALAASLLLASTVSNASARNLSTSNQGIRATWASLTLASPSGPTVSCPVTLEGSYHTRTIAKVARTLIGSITRATNNQAACTGGTLVLFNGIDRYGPITPSNTLPWHRAYVGFIGTLPNITGIIQSLARFRIGMRDAAGLCMGQYGTAEDSVSFNHNREAGGGITSIEPREGENRATLFRRDGGIFCPGSVELRGSGQMFLLGTTTRITITLI